MSDEFIPMAFVVLVVGGAVWASLREHPLNRSEVLQFVLSLLLGTPAWFILESAEGYARPFGTLLAGVGGTWFLMKLYAALRYGSDTKVYMD